MNEQIDITKISVESLKALAYDCVVQVQHWQTSLQQIERELLKRKSNTEVAQ